MPAKSTTPPQLYVFLFLIIFVSLTACTVKQPQETKLAAYQILLDENGDGLKSSSDIPLANLTVELFSENDELISQLSSDKDGFVYFKNRPAGSYLVVRTETSTLANSVLSCEEHSDYSLCTVEAAADTSDRVNLLNLTTQTLTESSFYILNVNSQLCVQVSSNLLDDGANIQQQTCANAPRQQWQLKQVTGGYSLSAAHSGKVMEVALAGLADGSNVEQNTWTAADNQIWDIVQDGDAYQLVALHSGKCLEVKQGRTGTGVTIWQNTCNGSDAQRFSFALVNAPAPDPDPTPDPTPNPNCGPLVQEAENGLLFGAIQKTAFANASGGFFVHTPDGDQAPFLKDSMLEPNTEHRMEYCFTVSEKGIYALKTFVAGFDDSDDSFWVKINDNAPFQYLFSDIRLRDPNPFPNFSEDYAKDRQGNDPVKVLLEPGKHYISFFMRETDSRLDRLELELLEATPDPIEPTCAGLVQEGEIAVLTGDFYIKNSPASSGGAYIETPSAFFKFQASAPNPHSASFCFSVPETGNYLLKGWLRFTGESHNSFHVVINDDFANTYLWDIGIGTFVEDFLRNRGNPNSAVLNLSAGNHKIVFYQREDGTRLDKLELIKID